MKDGIQYAAKLKKVYAKLKQASPDVPPPDPDDPVHRLGVSMLSVSGAEDAANRAIERALSVMAGWNEIRVSTPIEIHEALGGSTSYTLAMCKHLSEVLQGIFERENRLTLDHLRSQQRRDARVYLESLKGIDEYAVASVMLWSLGGHAIPVNDKLLAALRAAELVHPEATRVEVQAFLERHVPAAEGKEFCIVIRSLSAQKRAAGDKGASRATPKRAASGR